jgi:hypothetical protein
MLTFKVVGTFFPAHRWQEELKVRGVEQRKMAIRLDFCEKMFIFAEN